ncbi:MAG: hypothetical protein KC912_10820 [Proteobacteria bacterium]|nr:hypothetical protein [Pseudomonadota bacterium]
MSDDVWEAGAAAMDEDFGPAEPGNIPADEVVTIGNLIKWGAALLQEATVPLIGGGLLLWGIGFAAAIVAQLANFGGSILSSTGSDPVMAQVASSGIQMLVQLAAAPLLWVAMAGILSASAKAIVHGDVQPVNALPSASSLLAFIVSVLLVGFIQVPFLLFVGVLVGVAVAVASNVEEQLMYGAGAGLAGFAIVFLPLFYLQLRLRFAPAAAIVEGSGIEGIKASWRATSSFTVVLHLFLFALVEGAIAFVNVALCCTLGLLTVVTVPFLQGALMATYLRYSRSDEVLGESGFFARNG